MWITCCYFAASYDDYVGQRKRTQWCVLHVVHDRGRIRLKVISHLFFFFSVFCFCLPSNNSKYQTFWLGGYCADGHHHKTSSNGFSLTLSLLLLCMHNQCACSIYRASQTCACVACRQQLQTFACFAAILTQAAHPRAGSLSRAAIRNAAGRSREPRQP